MHPSFKSNKCKSFHLYRVQSTKLTSSRPYRNINKISALQLTKFKFKLTIRAEYSFFSIETEKNKNIRQGTERKKTNHNSTRDCRARDIDIFSGSGFETNFSWAPIET